MKKLCSILFTCVLSISALADYPQYESLGFMPNDTVRANPFKPSVKKQVATPDIQQSGTSVKSFKDILSQVLVPVGVKSNAERNYILLGDRFYSSGDVMQVEILKDAQSYDSSAEKVTIVRIDDKQFFVRVGEAPEEVSLALPQIETVHSEKPSFSSGAAKVTYLHREISVPTKK